MSVSIWATLGIEPTRDRGEIRRAYAAKLKTTNPEDDPAGFQTLRAAYERALAYADPPKAIAGGGGRAKRFVKVEAAEVVERPRRGGTTAPDIPDTDDAPDDADESEEGETPRSPRRREWRPADEKPADETPHAPDEPRPRQWRPPDPRPKIVRQRQRTHRPPDPVVSPDAANEEAYDEACKRVMLTLRTDDSAQQVAALKALFVSPAMDSVHRHARTESWLAATIMNFAPRADALIELTIGYFRWDEGRVGPNTQVGARVVSRREDLRFLATLRRPGAQFHAAFLALTKPPVGRRRAISWMTMGLDASVRSLLATLRSTRPGLMGVLDPAAVTWWDRRLERPHPSALALWILALLPAFLALLALISRQGDRTTPEPWLVYPLAVVCIGAGVLFELYAVAWPRHIWRRRWAARAPPWQRLGWAPALWLILVAAALIPPSWPAALALIGVAALVLLWVAIVGDPDRRPGARMPWQVRTVFSFTYLAIFWVMSSLSMPLPIYGQMNLPMMVAILAFMLGEGTLIGAWHRDLSERGRRIALAGLVAWAAVTAGLIFIARNDHAVIPFTTALVAIAVFAHKAPASTLGARRLRLRHYAMAYGWLGWVVFTAIVSPHHAPALMIGGLWLLTGVTITASMALDGVKWRGLVGGRAARKV